MASKKASLYRIPKNYHSTQRLEGLKNTTEEFSHLSKKRRCLLNVTDSTTPTLHCIINDLFSDDVNDQIDGTTRLCTLLSIGDNPPIEEVVQSRVVTRLVDFLESVNSSPQLQLQATWALTNIASGTSEQTQAVIDSGAVRIFVKLLDSPSDDVSEQAVWGLGNVAGDSPLCRDHVLECDALEALLGLLHDKPLPIIQKATWTICNLCKGVPRPDIYMTPDVFEALKDLISSDDEEILTNACWALCYLSDGTVFEYRDVADANVLPRLLQLLNYQSHSVIYAALRTAGHLIRHEPKGQNDVSVQTKKIIDNQGLPFIRNLLINNDCPVSIKKEACWIISRIFAEKEPQIQAVVDEDIIGPLIQLLKSLEFSIKKEAVLALKMACYYGSSEQVEHIVDRGCIKPVCNLLTSCNDEIVRHCLQLIAYILHEENNNGDRYRQMIVDAGGWDKVSFLENYGKVNDIKVYAKDLLSILEDGEGPPW